ncbi:transcriptional regulator [Streptomyces sp. CB02959]|uniref:MmyB family transcriptional regulator n=1 Tax=Streptomyces sp. CB02959 TaxID=2020330 RepID=UPI000C27F304|nr:transcriptional regulator [Streptomyces sp. CB02959]PJN32200.1 transcriptional regulator [Streptomyces sp. CB02959]
MLESGAHTRLKRDQCDVLSELLLLGRDEQQALVLYSTGGAGSVTPAPGYDSPTRRALQALLDQQMPNPTWLLDAHWNVIGYNEAMASWCPWVMEPGANLLRWALLSEEARTTFVDWSKHAVEYLAMLRFSLLQYPQNAELGALLADVTKDPELAHLWETRSEVTEARGAFYYRVSLPAHNYEIVELESQTLFPAALPDCRLVILNWIQRDDSDGDTGSATRPAVEEARSQPSASPLPGQVTASTADEAAKYAGPGAVVLPILSELISTGCQLTYSPTNRTVIWATPQHDGRWDVAEVNPYTVVVRMPQAIHVEGATAEYKLLTRAVLPAEPADAVQRIREMTAQLRRRIGILEEIHRDEWEADRSLPYG